MEQNTQEISPPAGPAGGWQVTPDGQTAGAPRALTELSMVQLLTLLRRRQLSPVELVEAHITRSRAVNPAINALIETAAALGDHTLAERMPPDQTASTKNERSCGGPSERTIL